jgi:hypothetical protein
LNKFLQADLGGDFLDRLLNRLEKTLAFDLSSPEQSDHLTLLIVEQIWRLTITGRGWSTTKIFPQKGTFF